MNNLAELIKNNHLESLRAVAMDCCAEVNQPT